MGVSVFIAGSAVFEVGEGEGIGSGSGGPGLPNPWNTPGRRAVRKAKESALSFVFYRGTVATGTVASQPIVDSPAETDTDFTLADGRLPRLRLPRSTAPLEGCAAHSECGDSEYCDGLYNCWCVGIGCPLPASTH